MSKPASAFDDGAEPLLGEENRVIGRIVPRHIHHVLRRAFPPLYGADKGYQLDGHACVGERDKKIETSIGGSLLYGEVLPEGVAKLCDGDHTAILNASTVFDYGMGTGKLCVQVFFQYPHLLRVVGVEISPSRFDIAAAALRRIAHCRRGLALIADSPTVCTMIDTTGTRRRVLEFRCCDVFDSLNPQTAMSLGDLDYNRAADIIFMNTDFPAACSEKLGCLFHAVRIGCRIATYSNVSRQYAALQKELKTQAPSARSEGSESIVARHSFPLVQHKCNVSSDDDRFRTTWSPWLGHHFCTWTKGTLAAGLVPVHGTPAASGGVAAGAVKGKAASEAPRFWMPNPAYNVYGGHQGSAAMGLARGGASKLPAKAGVAAAPA
jgi:hypothetical protein